MKNKQEFIYSGVENLEVMSEAHNYNNFLISKIISSSEKTADRKNKILDFGAGAGTYARLMKQRGYTVDCVEPDKKLKTILEKDGFKVYDDISQIKPNTYDLIYSLNVLEHIEHDADAISSIGKCLKSSGIAFLYVPAFQVLYSKMDKLVGHYRRYTIKMMRNKTDSELLDVESVSYCDPIGYFAALSYRIVGGSGQLSSKSVKFYDHFIIRISLALHPLTKKLFGKNVMFVARKK